MQKCKRVIRTFFYLFGLLLQNKADERKRKGDYMEEIMENEVATGKDIYSGRSEPDRKRKACKIESQI